MNLRAGGLELGGTDERDSFPQAAKSAACLFAFFTLGTHADSNAQPANSAETFVQSSIDRTYAILSEAALSTSSNSGP